jgi:PAS domain S-box-containing protein/putative nucleotidyltransferase with HDIG domain
LFTTAEMGGNLAYAVVLVACAAGCAIQAVFIWKKRPERGTVWIAMLLAAVSVWCLAYTLEFVSADIVTRYFFYRLTFIGKLAVPFLWFGFSLKYSLMDRFLRPRYLVPLALVPILGNVAIWTNEIHGLVWSAIYIDHTGTMDMLIKTPGLLFWPGAIYSYSLAVCGAIIVTRASLSMNEFSQKISVLVIGLTVPMLVNIGFALRPDIVNNIEITPPILAVCFCAGCWFVFRNGVLDLVPIARDKIIEQMRDGMIVAGPNGALIYCNLAAKQILGLKTDMGGKPKSKPDNLSCLGDITPGSRTISLEGDDGSTRYFDTQMDVLKFNGDMPGGFLISLHDITERKHTDEQLQQYREHLEDLVQRRTGELEIANVQLKEKIEERQAAIQAATASEERYRILVENASMAIVVVQDGFVKFVNPKSLEMTGYTQEDFESRYFLEFVSVEDRDVVASRYLRKLVGEMIPDTNPIRINCKNGTTKWAELNVVSIAWQGKPAVLNFLNDITERCEAEMKARHSFEKLQLAMQNTIKVMSSIVEMKDPYTAGHQSRVTALACAIAEEMKLPSEMVDGLRAACLVHDIGKITVPAEILSKPGTLNELEYVMIKRHTNVGYEILRQIEFEWPIAQIVLQHHERIDGSGYPNGLTGKDMMTESKILAVADVIEAMSSHRPYRPSLGVEKALEEITRNSGLLYDPEVVLSCMKLFREKAFAFQPAGSLGWA